MANLTQPIATIVQDGRLIGALCGMILGFFYWLNKSASVHTKSEIARWLERQRAKDRDRRNPFILLYQIVYTNHAFSLRGFGRSFITSSVIILALTLVGLYFSLEANEVSDWGCHFFTYRDAVIEFWLVNFLIVSVPCDYTAALITERVVSRIGGNQLSDAGLIFIGSVILLVLYFIGFYTYFIHWDIGIDIATIEKIGPIDVSDWEPIRLVSFIGQSLLFQDLEAIWPGANPCQSDLYLGNLAPFVYSSLFQLSWYILFLFGGMLIRLFRLGRRGFIRASWLFNVKYAPIMAIGNAAVLFIGAALVLYCLGATLL